MANFNKVILLGNLTRDPEVKQVGNGLTVAKLGMAVNRSYTTNGEKREETCYVDLTAFGRQAEVLGQYAGKGRPLMIEGRLQYSQWEDKTTGQKRNKLDVVIENFQFVGGRDAGEDGGGGGGGGRGARSSGGGGGGYEDASGGAADFDGIPF
ncbi:MAG: single-stranded DNA-binding protein [Planctomycetota bacterium]|nr:single-stranded DNA-binding protein [Planctomycetota bacterium]